ncbi:hypothetical protein CAPTEDRAFT_226595 [Capitella teleta]|uniref:BRICHOS domain-containing protein n=1 Tax=Capitella teleta TaxID=283909 RepID=R7T4B5_CAPTE|nr:hypothetical protein CAPTEDRAFT_226595 [Capitella teleta]|eukprot:ELT87621.1 hypothetical protein CAPTEDRAFT_226595 [Capitella teleta]
MRMTATVVCWNFLLLLVYVVRNIDARGILAQPWTEHMDLTSGLTEDIIIDPANQKVKVITFGDESMQLIVDYEKNCAGVFILSERRCFLISSLESLPRPGHHSARRGLTDLVDLTASGELASMSDLPDELRAVCQGLPVSTLLYSSKQRIPHNTLKQRNSRKRRQKRRAMSRKHCLMYFAAEICFNSGF